MFSQVRSLEEHLEKVEHAVQIGKEKQKDKVGIEDWTSFMNTHLLPVYNVADNDIKDATRRISSVRARAKKQEAKDAKQTADSQDSSDVEDAEDAD